MSRQRVVPVYAVNIAADPHPSDTYLRLLTKASTIIVNARGSDYARITEPVQNPSDENIYSGRFLVWTDIDIEGDWIDLERQDKLSEEDRKRIQIPEKARPNYRVFEYVFNLEKHVMFVEGKNDLDKTIGPTTVEKVLRTSLSTEALGDGFPEVAVTLRPEEGVTSELLAVPRIRTVLIRVHRPNPDVASPDAARRVYARMDEMNVHTIEERLSRNADADSIVLTGPTKDLAEVAVDNGVLRVQGRDAENKPVDLSSRDRPRKYDVPMDRNDSFLARVLEKIPGLR